MGESSRSVKNKIRTAGEAGRTPDGEKFAARHVSQVGSQRTAVPRP